jgi:signal peptidase I
MADLNLINFNNFKILLIKLYPLFCCLIFFIFIRTSVIDWVPVLSASMRPNIFDGDIIVVNLIAYDFKIPFSDSAITHIADPQRGDVVTFFSPKRDARFLKRIVALPGDKIEMRNEILFINDVRAKYVDKKLSESKEIIYFTEIVGK